MTFTKVLQGAILLIGVTACSDRAIVDEASASNTVSLRTLADQTSSPAKDGYVLQGDLIPTPSDPKARYFLLRTRKPLLQESHIALLRQEVGSRVAYARVELDCAKRLFHVLSVGNRRSMAETSVAYDGPLRSIEGLPLRQDIAAFVCKSAGTPLAAA